MKRSEEATIFPNFLVKSTFGSLDLHTNLASSLLFVVTWQIETKITSAWLLHNFFEKPFSIQFVNVPDFISNLKRSVVAWCSDGMQSWRPRAKSIPPKPKIFRSVSENDRKKISFEWKVFPKTLLWTRRIEFRKPCQKFLQEARKIFVQSSKMIKKHNFFRKKNPKKFQWTCRMQFWHPPKKTFDRNAQNFPLNWQKVWKIGFFKKISFPQKLTVDTLIAVLTTPAKNIRQKAELFSLKVQNWLKSIFFLKKYVFFTLLLWTRRKQFWQPCRKKNC